MTRWRTMTATAGAAILTMIPLASVQAAQPAIYHTIESTHAFAAYAEQEGCLRTDVYVSSSEGTYAAQPGPVSTQAMTALSLRVVDTCGVSVMAGGGEGNVLFDGLGVVDVGPTVGTRLSWAEVGAVVPVTDDLSGDTVEVDLAVRWTASAPLEHDTVHNRVRFPGAGIVHANDNNRLRAATAVVDAAGPVATVSGVTEEASLEQVKSICMEIVLPGYDGDSDWCY